ncbi:RNA-directed DNA polymerase, eukaryota [Tanacetum coccineum]
MDEEWDPQKVHEQGTSNEEEELGSEKESEEDSDWEEGDGYEDEQWEDSVAGDGNFRQRVVESEGSHNGLMDGEVPKVMGDGEGGAEYMEESREDATIMGFIEGQVSEKNNNTINCECVATEAKAKSDNQNERSRSNRNKDAIKSHTRSKERSSYCGKKLKGKLNLVRRHEADDIRGLGTNDKVDWIRELCYKEKPDVVGIQETKLRKIDFKTINKLWGSDEVDFIKLDVVGRSGGILTMWDTRVFNKVQVISDHGFVAVVDFNEVRRLDERLNSEFSKKGALAFNDFIRSEQLIDVPLGGKRFTRISDDGRKFSKLDRFLITKDFQEIWRNLGSVALDRKLSDHCPIVLLDKGLDFGPKPFRFFDAWLKDVEMIDVVKEAWGAPVSTITPDCVFRDKLKNVKHALKKWSKKYSGLEQEFDSSKKEADGLKAKMLRQKARVRWYEEGDENSNFFHSTVRKRYQKNGFTGLMVDGRWNKNREDIKQTVLNYYQGVFKEANSNRPSFASGRFRRLSQGDASLLEAPFEDKEIWSVVKACGSSKASGPDAESLNVAMQEIVQGGLFDGVKVGSDGIEVSHLQYADDTIFVGDWNRRNIISLMKLLKCFQMASGLKVNLNKSTLFGISVEMEEVEGWATDNIRFTLITQDPEVG